MIKLCRMGNQKNRDKGKLQWECNPSKTQGNRREQCHRRLFHHSIAGSDSSFFLTDQSLFKKSFIIYNNKHIWFNKLTATHQTNTEWSASQFKPQLTIFFGSSSSLSSYIAEPYTKKLTIFCYMHPLFLLFKKTTRFSQF